VTIWDRRVAERLDGIRAEGRWRSIRALDGAGHHFRTADGSDVVSFASNDYLGLATHPAPRAAAIDAVHRWGTGSASARLIVGDRPPHRALEADLADWRGTEAALVLPTGFAANLGVVTALGAAGVLVASDELNHASIIDGGRLARGSTAVYRHRDLDHLSSLLAAHDGPRLVVSETVFSMDGDAVDLAALVAACRRYDALLVLDEAHAVLGPDLAAVDTSGLTVVRVGTLSKTLGSVGGFVAGSRPVIDLLVNTARSFIFTTAPAPADTAAARAALEVLRSPEGDARRACLRRHIDRLAPGHPSAIVPVVVGDEARAVAASATLLIDHGLLVPAIRPPTVPAGTCRLRIGLSAAHTDDDVSRLVAALAAIGAGP
jgi:8-amino-7-oxononanoate synthase